jgi:phosphatidate cytidylyltransferase
MHLKRWITGLVGIIFLVLLISKGGSFLFAAVISIASIFALWEYFRIVFHDKGNAYKELIPLLAFVTGPAIVWAAYLNSTEIVLGLIAINLIGSAIISLAKFKHDSSVLEIVAKQVLGVVYIPLFLSYLVLIRNGAEGVAWIYLLLFIIFSGDTGAYYIGSNFGRHQLSPTVSPNKTIEGAVGGLAMNVGVGSLIKYFFLPSLPWGLSVLLFLSVGVAGQLGDLFESVLKRTGDIKDSSALLPGHGGILDRIDAVLFAAPVFYLFKEYFF